MRATALDKAITQLKDKIRILELAIAELEKQRIPGKVKAAVTRIRRDKEQPA